MDESRTKDPPVTVSVTRRAKPGREEEFERFLSGVIRAASRQPGHLGANVLRPSEPGDRTYRLIFKFDRESNLRRWEESEERQAWLARADELGEGVPERRVVTGLEGWFSLPRQRVVAPPPRRKMVLVAWLGVYPLITAISFFLGPVLAALPLPLRTMLLSGIMLPTMFYAVMPVMTRLFRRWLYPPEPIPEGARPTGEVGHK